MQMKTFESETYRIGMRNDLNLIYTMCHLINTLTKISTPEAQDLAVKSAHVVCKTASELMRHVNCLYDGQTDDQNA